MVRVVFLALVVMLLLVAVAAVFAGALIGGGGGGRTSDLAVGPSAELTTLKTKADTNFQKLLEILPSCLEQQGQRITKEEVRQQLLKAIEEKGEQAFLLSTTGGDVEVSPRGGWGAILTELVSGDANKAGAIKQCAIDQGFDPALPPPQFVTAEISQAVADTGYFGSGYLYRLEDVTADQLNGFIARKTGNRNSVMIGIGNDILAVSRDYHLNPVYIMAHAGLESDWGRSRIAIGKNNLFGYGAHQPDPYDSAHSYSTVKEGIQIVMSRIKKDYLTPGGRWYAGQTLEGMNYNYASDKDWAGKIKQRMAEFYRHIGRTPNL